MDMIRDGMTFIMYHRFYSGLATTLELQLEIRLSDGYRSNNYYLYCIYINALGKKIPPVLVYLGNIGDL